MEQAKTIGQLTVEELKRELGKRNVNATGPKVILVKRLKKIITDDGDDPEEMTFSDDSNTQSEAKVVGEKANADLKNGSTPAAKTNSTKGKPAASPASGKKVAKKASPAAKKKVAATKKEPTPPPEETKDEEPEGEEEENEEVNNDTSVEEKPEEETTKDSFKMEEEMEADESPQKEDDTSKDRFNDDNFDEMEQPDYEVSNDYDNVSLTSSKNAGKTDTIDFACMSETEDNDVLELNNDTELDLHEVQSKSSDVLEEKNKSKTQKNSSSGVKSTKNENRTEKKDKQVDSKNDQSRKLWVSGLSAITKAADLKNLFSKHAKVLSAKIVTNANTPGSRCFGMVTVASEKEALDCIKELNVTELLNRFITIKMVAKKEDKKPVKKVVEKKKVDDKPSEPKKPIKRGDPKSSKDKGLIKGSDDARRERMRREREAQRERQAAWRQQEREKLRQAMREKEAREREWRIREEERQRMVEARNREEAMRLEREREKIIMERERIERERAELMRLERERMHREAEERKRLQQQKDEMLFRLQEKAAAALKRQEFESRKRQSDRPPFDPSRQEYRPPTPPQGGYGRQRYQDSGSPPYARDGSPPRKMDRHSPPHQRPQPGSQQHYGTQYPSGKDRSASGGDGGWKPPGGGFQSLPSHSNNMSGGSNPPWNRKTSPTPWQSSGGGRPPHSDRWEGGGRGGRGSFRGGRGSFRGRNSPPRYGGGGPPRGPDNFRGSGYAGGSGGGNSFQSRKF